MAYAVFFLLVGGYCFVQAVSFESLAWLWLWLGVSFSLVGAAYLGLGPVVLGKRANGSIACWAWIVLWPYLVLVWTTWRLLRFVSREDCCNEVAPGVWLGRRPLRHELPPGIVFVVDLTSEFTAAVRAAAGRKYRCVPVLDGTAPPLETLRTLSRDIADWPGAVYIHCAVGHGRSATVAAAVLLARGLAANPREAVALLRKSRPLVRLSRVQRRVLERLASSTARAPSGGSP